MAGDVQLRQLEYLVALARERHFGRAAESCHAGQSTLSAALRALERQLGVTIVHRSHRFQGCTAEGERVVGWAHRILAERDALRDDLARMREGLSAVVRIGAIPTAVPATAALTAAWTEAHPRAGVRVEVLSAREIDRRLAEFELDAGLTYLAPGEDGVSVLPLYRERYLLLGPADSSFADRDSLGWGDVSGVELCALTTGMQNRRLVDEAVRAAGGEPRIVVETDTVAAVYAHLATTRWSAVIAHTWLRAFGDPDGMRALPIEAADPRPTVGLRLGDHGPASYVARALLDAVAAAGVATELDGAWDVAPSVDRPTVPRWAGLRASVRGFRPLRRCYRRHRAAHAEKIVRYAGPGRARRGSRRWLRRSTLGWRPCKVPRPRRPRCSTRWSGEQLYHHVLGLIAEAGWEHPETHAGHLVGEFPHERIDGEERGSYITAGNSAPLRRVSPSGKMCHWILEIHIVDSGRGFGGFHDQLLDI